MKHNWGKGWEVSINKAIWQHHETMRQARAILKEECGIKHYTGSHDLCPMCGELRVNQDNVEAK